MACRHAAVWASEFHLSKRPLKGSASAAFALPARSALSTLLARPVSMTLLGMTSRLQSLTCQYTVQSLGCCAAFTCRICLCRRAHLWRLLCPRALL